MTPYLIIWVASAAATSLAHAGPYRDEIAQLQSAARRAETVPGAAPTAPQSVGAQLGHQPTPQSVKQAEEQANSRVATVLSRAAALDAQGKEAECMRAAIEARRLLDLN